MKLLVQPLAAGDIEQQILLGLQRGVDRYWRYTKELFKVKPEYLLTISVADALSEGVGTVSGLDLEIRLEEPTRRVASSILMDAVGWKRYFKAAKPTISRKGKVDIYLVAEAAGSHVIELKGFNPSGSELRKDVQRLLEFLGVNGLQNRCGSGHLAFPATTDRSGFITRQLKKISIPAGLVASQTSKVVVTDEDPEDGMPSYLVHCITISRAHKLS